MGLMRKKQVYTAKRKRWHQKRYRTRFENGLCPECGKKRIGEWITCVVCREKGRLRKQKKCSSPTALKANREYINKYRKKCREEGICYGCGSYIGLGRYIRCVACRDKDRIAHEVAYRKKALRGMLARIVPCPTSKS